MKLLRRGVIVWLAIHTCLFFLGLWLLMFKCLHDLGIGIIASAVVGYFLLLYIAFSESFSEKISMLITLGLHQAFTQRGPKIEPSYENRIASAKTRIWVMACRGGKFKRHFGNQFSEWAQNEKLDVRILLSDPEFPTVDNSVSYLRDLEEPRNSHSPGRSKEDIEAFVSFYKNSISGIAEIKKFKLKLARCMPAFTMVLIDKEIIWGPYFVNVESSETPSFLIKQGGELYDDFEKQFIEIWESPSYSRDVLGSLNASED